MFDFAKMFQGAMPDFSQMLGGMPGGAGIAGLSNMMEMMQLMTKPEFFEKAGKVPQEEMTRFMGLMSDPLKNAGEIRAFYSKHFPEMQQLIAGLPLPDSKGAQFVTDQKSSSPSASQNPAYAEGLRLYKQATGFIEKSENLQRKKQIKDLEDEAKKLENSAQDLEQQASLKKGNYEANKEDNSNAAQKFLDAANQYLSDAKQLKGKIPALHIRIADLKLMATTKSSEIVTANKEAEKTYKLALQSFKECLTPYQDCLQRDKENQLTAESKKNLFALPKDKSELIRAAEWGAANCLIKLAEFSATNADFPGAKQRLKSAETRLATTISISDLLVDKDPKYQARLELVQNKLIEINAKIVAAKLEAAQKAQAAQSSSSATSGSDKEAKGNGCEKSSASAATEAEQEEKDEEDDEEEDEEVDEEEEEETVFLDAHDGHSVSSAASNDHSNKEGGSASLSSFTPEKSAFDPKLFTDPQRKKNVLNLLGSQVQRAIAKEKYAASSAASLSASSSSSSSGFSSSSSISSSSSSSFSNGK